MMTARSWVVALEVDEDPDGPNLDVKAVARTMDAVAGIHPSGTSGRRHSFLVRLDGNDPADALVAAVTRFRQAPVNGGALLGARVVRPEQNTRTPDDKAPPARHPILRPRILAGIACALLGGAALLALVPDTGGSSANGGSQVATLAGAREGTGSANLLSNGSFESAAAKPKGLARGATAWGDLRAALVDAPVHSGRRAQRLEVGAGQRGGVWFEVAASAGTTYEQSAWVQVQDLPAGSRAEMIVEWYGPDGALLDYRTLPLTTTDAGLVRRAQAATAPAGTSKARFLVNFTSGGALVIDDADVRPATAAGSP